MANTQTPLGAALEQVVQALAAAKIKYAVMGALAAIVWGRPRTTLDLDIVVDASLEDVRRCFERLGMKEGRSVGEPDSPDFTQYWTPENIRVDLFFARTAFEQAAVDTARVVRIGDLSLSAIGAESAIIYKLIAHRPRDLDDVEAIFLARSGELDWDVLEHWSKEWELEEYLAPFRARFKS